MHSEYDFLQDRNNELEHENSMLHEQVTELQDENMSLMDKCETLESGLPHPCTFDGKRHVSEYTLRDWLEKLKEEVAEVEVEVEKMGTDVVQSDIDKLDREGKADCLINLVEECTDVITVATSILDWVGLSVWGRCRKQRDVNEKNKRRGYWE
jgi:predicted RNase H-like nuclease (RuvC/YqgF family)